MASKAATKPADTSSAQELVDTKDHAIVTAEHADMMSGGSDFNQSDLSIPFLRIIQALSPQLQKAEPQYDPDADQGMICETVTPRFFDGDEGLILIPVMYQRSYTEWKPNRGGLVADYGSDPAILSKCTKVTDKDGKTRTVTEAGNEISEAAQYYVLYAPYDEDAPFEVGGEFEQAILTMAGTQWKQSRDWNTNMQRVRLRRADGSIVKNPLPFAQSYHFTTLAQKKDNYNFYGWQIKPHAFTLSLPSGEELANFAANFRKLAATGAVKGNDGGAVENPNVDGPVPF